MLSLSPVIAVLLQAGADVLLRNKFQNGAIQTAVESRNVETVAYLLDLIRTFRPEKLSEFANSRCPMNRTPIDYAILTRHVDLVRVLGPVSDLSHDPRYLRLPYLEHAVFAQRLEVLNCLLELPFPDQQVINAIKCAKRYNQECYQILKREADRRGLVVDDIAYDLN
jgi:ankyrin repeat protein